MRDKRGATSSDGKRQRLDGVQVLPVYATKFSQEEIAAESRQPKRKVAVLIGYSGTGYKGMQLNHQEKTIEGDLFSAFVKAGAISKANADDPKKSSLVRCARTDKGVHAAGNVISLKLVVEDADLIAKINQHLNPQIRVWGISRTNNGFSAYQACDSRIYEYLIPSYCLLPPIPECFLARQLQEIAVEAHDSDAFQDRNSEVADFWPQVQSTYIEPLLADLTPEDRREVMARLTSQDDTSRPKQDGEAPRITSPLDQRLKDLKAEVARAKREYRIHPTRLARLDSVISRFVGTHRYHNFTVDKQPKDPSAMRVIKSFTVNPQPILIQGTEWLSLKVHGQSFMMHQIRKMISAAVMMIRCGCPEHRLEETYLPEKLAIPKAPSLGLLLERPIFDAYDCKLMDLGHEKIDFSACTDKMLAFKQEQIYNRIYREEENEGVFLAYFSGLDVTKDASLLWLSSLGREATKRTIARTLMP